MFEKLPIEYLIDARCQELAFGRAELVARMYANAGKGHRRLAQLCRGDLDGARDLVERLPDALDLPREAIDRALRETRSLLERAAQRGAADRDAAWRAAFRPHAIIITDRSVPEPIFVAAIIGVERLLLIKLSRSRGERSFIEQAKAGIRRRLSEWHSDQLPAFGGPVGFVVNYAPDRAVRCDLKGNVLEVLDEASQLGAAALTAKRRPIGLG